MQKEFKYNKFSFLEKLIIAAGVITAGLLIDTFIPTVRALQRILVILVYITGGFILFFEALPSIYRSIRARGTGIILTNRSLVIQEKNMIDNLAIDRSNIKRVEFNSLTASGFTIKPERRVEEIDENIYNLPGRRLEITYENPGFGQQQLVIYLELLDDEFLEEFIDWYQGDRVIPV